GRQAGAGKRGKEVDENINTKQKKQKKKKGPGWLQKQDKQKFKVTWTKCWTKCCAFAYRCCLCKACVRRSHTTHTQHKRAKAGLAVWFSVVYTSGCIKHQQPSAGINIDS